MQDRHLGGQLVNIRVFIPVDKAEFHRFLATEPEGRYEFERGRIVQQMPGTRTHYEIAQRFLLIILGQIDRRVWSAFNDWGLETAETVRFGDVVVSPADEPGEDRWTKKPALIVEVLSPTSVARDLDLKPGEYTSLPSLQAYIVASQDEAACMVWMRDATGAFPVQGIEIAGIDKSIAVPALGLDIRLADVYRGLT
jgi:Uma2 family endonuclease